jgi:hypothetical protein
VENIMKQAAKIAVGSLVLLTLGACVAGSAESAHAASSGMVSEFFLGLWHGIIGPVTLIVEIINHFMPRLLPWKAHLFETRASGVAYDFGFYLGLAGSPIVIWTRRP